MKQGGFEIQVINKLLTCLPMKFHEFSTPLQKEWMSEFFFSLTLLSLHNQNIRKT